MLRIIIGQLLMCLITVAAHAQFTQWSAPVNLGSPVNSASPENCVSISKDGLTLYFARSTTSYDLYFSKRASVDAPWGVPELVPNVNTGATEWCPALSLDEHKLYFASDRSGGCGSFDIYVSRRHDRQDDRGWEPPANLGCESEGYVNTSGDERTPYFFEDETGKLWMYFSSSRAGSLGYDIYATYMRNDDTFGSATPVAELNSPYNEIGPAIRRDGLEIVFDSTRPGGLGGRDIWSATRDSTSDPWSVPVNLTILNSRAADGARMSFSFDGRMLYFMSTRSGGWGNSDIYVAIRERLHGK